MNSKVQEEIVETVTTQEPNNRFYTKIYPYG
jgi:hypothetical protein